MIIYGKKLYINNIIGYSFDALLKIIIMRLLKNKLKNVIIVHFL